MPRAKEFRPPLDRDGIWREVRAPARTDVPRPALFLDRDGTIVEEVPYLSRPELVAPIPGALALIARANALDIPVVIVTNQSGVGRGYHGWREYAAVAATVDQAVAAAGGRIDAVYACPHPPAAATPGATAEPFTRKPNPGMLLSAAADLNLDLEASWIAGDTASDLEAGRRAGLRRGWLVPTGLGPRHEAAALALAGPDFEVVTGLPLDRLAARLDQVPGAQR